MEFDDARYAVFVIHGQLDLEHAAKIGDFVNLSIPFDYQGNIVFDLRVAEDLLQNQDADQFAKLVFKSRYFLQNPVAVLAPAS